MQGDVTAEVRSTARRRWREDPGPWLIEERLLERYDIPLNLDQNKHNRFHPELSNARKQAKQRAAELPVLPR